jgi:hypothetical protein
MARIAALILVFGLAPAMLLAGMREGASMRWAGALAAAAFAVGVMLFRTLGHLAPPDAAPDRSPSSSRLVAGMARDALAWGPVVLLLIELLRPYDPRPWHFGVAMTMLVVAALSIGQGMRASPRWAPWVNPAKNALAAFAIAWFAIALVGG